MTERKFGTTALAASVLLLALVPGASGCSTLLRSDSAEFREEDGKGREGGTGRGGGGECGLGPPAYVKAPAPADSALFGGSLTAHGDSLVSNAWFEKPPRWESPDAGSTEGVGVIRIYSGVADRLEAPRAEATHAPDSPSILPPEGLPRELDGRGLVTTHAIAIAEDWLAVGDAGRDGFRGAVRLFERQRGWSEAYSVRRDDGEEGDFFGLGMALAGNTLIVAAPGADRGARDAGAFFVYELRSTGAELVDVFEPPAPRATGWFGAAMDLSPDWLVVTAPGDEHVRGSPDDGAAYAFHRGPRSIDRTPQRIPRPLGSSYFGSSVSISGDWLAIGAPGTVNAAGAVFAGAAHLFQYTEEKWSLVQTVDTGDLAGTLFGWTVALAPGALVVGFPWATPRDGLATAGTVHVFDRDESGLGASCRLLAPNPDVDDAFGTALAMGDGFLAVSAPFEDGAEGGVGAPDSANERENSGAVYVYPWKRSAQSAP